ncbi:MAG TPA: RDD family protein [Pseudomonadales bacterium]
MNDALPLAGRGRRLAATVVDLILVPLATVVLVMLFDVVEDAEDYQSSAWIGWVLLLAVVSYLILNGWLLARRGQTLGKALFRIRIATADGGVPPLWKLVGIRALFFPLLYLLPVWPFTLLPVADQATIFGRGRRCLHDFAAGTRVVRAGDPAQPAQ